MRQETLESAGGSGRLRTSHARVVGDLGRDIVSGRFGAGCILPGDAELERRFNVSRTVLREAMKTLGAKGLIRSRARIGTRVTDRREWNLFDSEVLLWHFETGVSEKFLLQLEEIRLALETCAAGLAALHASGAEIERLEQQVAELEGLRKPSVESMLLAELRFHIAVAEASHNPFLRSAEGLVKTALVGMFRHGLPLAAPLPPETMRDAHLRVVAAIRARDRHAAERAMREAVRAGMRPGAFPI